MRRESTKTAKQNRQRAKDTALYVAEVGHCQNPECNTPHCQLHVHEIKGGECRQITKMHRLAQLILCDVCNCGDFHDRAKWPIPRQLALKLLVDPQHFDHKAFCLLLNPNAPKRFDGDDIIPYVRELLITFPQLRPNGVDHG